MRNCYWDTESLAYSKEFKPVSVTIIKRNTQQAQRFLIHPTAHYLGSTYTLFCLFLSAFHLLFPLLPSPFIFFFSFLSFKILNLKTRQGSLILSLFIFFLFSLYQLTTFTLKEKKKKKFCAYLFSKNVFPTIKKTKLCGILLKICVW